MKLKKIASLMLAGVMAVSMLAGCSGSSDNGENGGASSNPNPSTGNYTETVLAKTNGVTKARLNVSTNSKLDDAVEFAAENDRSTTVRNVTTINWANNDNWALEEYASTVMGAAADGFRNSNEFAGLDFSESANLWNKTPKPYTLWTIGVVSATVRDDVVDKMVADALDKLALELQDDTNSYTYDFDVRVAKADCKGGDLSKADDDYVVIGIALTCGRTAVKY